MTWPIKDADCAGRLRFDNARIPPRDGARQLRTVEAIVERLGSQPGVIVADEVGMGKTFVALGVALMAALNDADKRPVIIMVPSSLHAKWPRDFAVFRDLVIRREEDREIRVAQAGTALELFRLLDDRDAKGDRHRQIIFLKHGAFHVHQVDAWVRLAVIKRAIRGLHLGRRRDRLPEFAAELIRVKSRFGDPDLFGQLLDKPSSDWKCQINGFLGDGDPLCLKDDPVPEDLQKVLDLPDFDVGELSESLRELPERRSTNISERLATVRRAINVSLRDIWPRALKLADFKSPLLILDEAHHLKNPATRLASLFVTKEHGEEARIIDGALQNTFERMLLLTATPFQLGHAELLNVMDRFRGIDWTTLPGQDAATFASEMAALESSLDGAQAASSELDKRWARLNVEQLGGKLPEDWWDDLRRGGGGADTRGDDLLKYFDATKAAMSQANRHLSKWVVRHLRDPRLPGTEDARRCRMTGASIRPGSDAETAGLPVSGESLLPFLLAARAQAAVARNAERPGRATFADGLASSYEAFLETRAGKVDADELEASAAAGDPALDRIGRYLDKLTRALPDAEAQARHPKIAAVVERVADLWAKGEKVIVFCHYIATGKALRRHISAAIAERLWSIATERSGLSLDEAKERVRLLEGRFDTDASLGRELAVEIQRRTQSIDTLSESDRHDIEDVVRRFLRTDLFICRYFDLATPDDRLSVAQAFAATDESGRSLGQKIDDFIRFVSMRQGNAEPGVLSERATYFDALKRVMSGVRSGDGNTQDPSKPADDRAPHEQGGLWLPNVRLANGATDPESRQRMMLSFNTPFFPEVLVASSVFAEGVDLHLNCRYVIHHDLSWNPSTIEQRTGRVDRLGAKAEQVRQPIRIFMPYVAATQDEKQFRVVTDRERWFQVLMGEDYPTDESSTDAAAERVPLPESAVADLAYDLAVYKE